MPVTRPLVVAHRGASAYRAEHTLAAYLLALEQGADGLECDVRLTRDGHLVCLHDRRVDRTSTGRGAVSALSLAQLASFDYSDWHDELDDADDLVVRRSARRDPRGGLLTLTDLLALVVDWPRPVRLFIETKHPVRYSGLVETRLVEQLKKYGLDAPEDRAASPVLVMSFSVAALRRTRAAAPTLPTVALFSVLNGVRNGRLPPWADVAGPGVRALRADPGFVERTAERGYPTYCWTVDEPDDVSLCAKLGVSYVATNRPAETRQALATENHPG